MSLMPGMDIYAKGKVYPLTSPTNPGQFDEWMYRRSDGYAVKFSSASLQAYERKNASILGSIRCMAYSVRLKVSEYISDILPQKKQV